MFLKLLSKWYDYDQIYKHHGRQELLMTQKQIKIRDKEEMILTNASKGNNFNGEIDMDLRS